MFGKTKKLLVVGVMGFSLALGASLVQPETAKACNYSALGGVQDSSIGAYPGYVLSVARGGYDYKVLAVQTVLHNLYFESGDTGYKVDTDGYFGTQTQRAVLHYQELHGLQIDGQVGPATWSSMYNHKK